MISVYFQSCGPYIPRTSMLCPCCAHARLISAINADLRYTHFPALFSFYFVIIFRALVGALYSIQRSGNIFLRKTNLRSVKVCRSYEHKEAGMQTALQSHMKHLLTSTHGSSTGNYIIISLYKALSFNSPSDPRSRK